MLTDFGLALGVGGRFWAGDPSKYKECYVTVTIRRIFDMADGLAADDDADGMTEGVAPRGEPPCLEEQYYFTPEQATEALRHLRKYGVAVIIGALSSEEVGKANTALETDLQKRPTGIGGKRSHGLFGDLGIGQCEAVWRVRGSLGVQAAFAAFWNVEPAELITSMDAIIVWERHRTLAGGWLHRDRPRAGSVQWQGNSARVIQAQVAMVEATEETGGFVVCPGDNFGERDDLPWQLVKMRPGDLACWDAGCRHGSEPPFGEQGAAGRRVRQRVPLAQYKRVAVPVCMVPRQCASPEVLEERRRLFHEGRVAQHEPHLVVPHPAGDKFVYALPSSQSWWTERMRRVL